MKKILKKNIAVILSAVLILSAILPVFSGVVANAYTAENTVIKSNIDTACDNLIAEWNKLTSTDGLDKLTPYELFNEAAALDLSGFNNTDAFITARQNLATILVNSFDPTEIKNAWKNIYGVVSGDFYSPFALTGTGTSDAVYFKSGSSGVTVNPIGEDERNIWGAKSVTFDYALGTNRTAVTGSTDYEIFLSSNPENIEDAKLSENYSNSKRLYDISDLQFSFIINEINTAATGAKMGFKVSAIIDGNFGVFRSAYYININEDMVGKVQTIRFSDIIAGISSFDETWLEGFQTTDSVTRIELQLCDNDSANNAAVNMTLGSVVSLRYLPLPSDEEAKNWNVSDWVYAARGIDITGLYDVDAFETAIQNAEELKEISGVEISRGYSEYNDLAAINLPSENVLSGIMPTISYYDGVSDSKTERFCSDYRKLADGNVGNPVNIEAGNFKKEGAFLEFVYDLSRIYVIEKTAVISGIQENLRNYRYKIYAAKTESELFTAESFVNSYINVNSSVAQVFDHTVGPELCARYIVIRIYAPCKNIKEFDGFVRLNELGVYGFQKDYDTIASEFSADTIKNLGQNILTNRSTMAYVRADTGNRQKFTSLFNEETYPITNLYDADVLTTVGIGDNYRMYYDGDTTSLHIYYDLGDTYSIEKFLFASDATTLNITGKYRIHASNDLNYLFNGKSVIIDYDNTVSTTRMQVFSMKTPVAARYVSFEVTMALADYNAWVARYGINHQSSAVRISELGIYGSEYKKENTKENLLSHVPVTVNRVDNAGNKTALGQNEYGGAEHKVTYDGDYETFTTISADGKSIEYNYNLNHNADIDNIRFISNSANIFSVKFYASSSGTAVLDESALVYTSKDASKTIFEKYFVDTCLTASYLRIVVTLSSGDLEVVEIEANGYNKNKATYENLFLNRTDYVRLSLVDSSNNMTAVDEDMDKWIPGWSSASEYQTLTNAFDGDLGTVYTYYGGVNNDTSVNMFFNMRSTNCVDNISVYTSILDDYRPSKMNIYVGDSQEELFAADATPIKSWTEKILSDAEEFVPEDDEEEGEDIIDGSGENDDDIIIDFETGATEGELPEVNIKSKEKTPEYYGLYSADFAPMEISCVRIEIIDANPKYFSHINKVGGIISEVQINGFSSVGNAVDGVLESSKDMVMRALDPVNTKDKSGNSYTNSITDGIEGEPVYTVNSIGENVALNSCDASGGYIEYMQTNTLADGVTLADIEDIYFSYRVKKSYRSGTIAARVYIYNGSAWAHGFANRNGTETVIFVDSTNTEWVHTSMSKQFGENWKEKLLEAYSGKTEQTTTINRIRFGWNNVGGAADMQFTGMYYTFNDGASPYYNALATNLGKNGQQAALTMNKYFKYNSLGVNTQYTANPITPENGDTYYSFEGIGGEYFGNGSCVSGSAAIAYKATDSSKNRTLAEIDDIYISYKIDKAISGANTVARIYIYDQNGKLAESFSAGTVRVFYFSTTHTDWNTISVRAVAGNNWKSELVESFNAKTGEIRMAEDIKISEIRFGFNKTGEADMSFGNIYYQYCDEMGSTISLANAVSYYNTATKEIDVSCVAKKTAKEFKYNVQFLADYLELSESDIKYISGNHNKTAVDMKDLAILAQYLDKTMSDDDFMDPYCADINGDGTLSEADLSKLRKQLLGIQ
ncbi:MAG: dockerin type I repeat-containing protein [Clostridia bacterium]|nr:dockerin type I repeat-containing protein [Clostridia bacterium]